MKSVTVQRCQVEDVVGRLLRNGLLDPDWAGAAERFRRDYRSAHYQPLGVRALQRQSSRAGQPPVIDRVEDARSRVGDALGRLGGLASPAGSIVWHVVGGEMSLNEWRERQRLGAGRVFRHEMAAGILIAAAGALAAHYAGGPASRRGGAPRVSHGQRQPG